MELAEKISLLAYSKYVDGAFCLPCVCFGVQCGRNTNKLDKLYKSPLTLWTSAISRFTEHASGKCQMHNFAEIAMENFLTNTRREAIPIDLQMNNLLQQQINRNREILKSLLNTTRGFKSLHWVAFLNIRRTLDFRIHLSNLIKNGLHGSAFSFSIYQEKNIGIRGLNTASHSMWTRVSFT